MEMYHITTDEAAGRGVMFSGGKMQVGHGAQYSLQRPETAETLMYLYRMTGDEQYRVYGGEIIDAIERHSKVANGFSGLRDVNAVPPPLDDFQQSFLLGRDVQVSVFAVRFERRGAAGARWCSTRRRIRCRCLRIQMRQCCKQ
jgi:hypothetical protein